MDNYIIIPKESFKYRIIINDDIPTYTSSDIKLFMIIDNHKLKLKLNNFITIISGKFIKVKIINNFNELQENKTSTNIFTKKFLEDNIYLGIHKIGGIPYPTNNLSKKEIAKLKLLL